MKRNPNEPIKTNQTLNQTPLVGNLVSEELAGPLGVSVAIGIGLGCIGVPLGWCIGIVIWAAGGWILFAGKEPYRQKAKLTKKIPKWFTARTKYEPREAIKLRQENDYQ